MQAKFLRLIIDEEALEFSADNEKHMLFFRVAPDTIGTIVGCQF